jgi:phosphoribosylaminoimidazolecarboxamide formyltransferase/IMP cyclohydrolase
MELSPLAMAYARARGADRLSSFGDWAALSDVVDVSAARFIKREVSDGVIAPGFEPEALSILKEKKEGKYCIVQIDPAFEPGIMETREVFGISFEQRRNDVRITDELLRNIVTAKKDLPPSAQRDLLISLITLKYTQSNSVCFVFDGQVIGVGAGQQSRVHCTRLAGLKADKWFLRQHPSIMGLKFKKSVKRPERDNAIDQYLEEDLTLAEERFWREAFDEVPRRLSREEKRKWLDAFSGVSLGSDAFFPFRDSIDRAAKSGVSYVVQPGNSVRDDVVIEACNEYGMAMAFCGTRLFHH